ncbi:MAG: BolA family transcriptional regulator [Alphaproteobacteria bacterium]|nr:MAG: BolA family transcriptional regulator [Alphaproteobacteria bacterium]
MRVRRLLTFQVATFKSVDMTHDTKDEALTGDALLALLAAALPGAAIEHRDDTHKHLHHNEMVDHHGAHFFVRVTWAGFAGMGRLARHRLVHDKLAAQWDERQIHSLSLRLMTPEEALG